MSHPVIIIKDPLSFDYCELINQVFELTSAINTIDIYIIDEITNSNDLNSILYHYYSYTRKLSFDKGYDYRFEINVIFNIDNSPVHLFKLIQTWNMAFVVNNEQGLLNLHHISTVPITIKRTPISFPKTTTKGKQQSQFDVAAVGGTFDHIHDGHKILVSVSAFLAKHKLIIGITGNELLKNKQYHQVLQSFTERQASVLSFLKLIVYSSTLQFEIYEINDICGPTGYVKDIDCLILSDETLSGGEYVNNYRKSRGFNELETIIIRVVGSGNTENQDDNYVNWKLSSTNIRHQIFKRLQL